MRSSCERATQAATKQKRKVISFCPGWPYLVPCFYVGRCGPMRAGLYTNILLSFHYVAIVHVDHAIDLCADLLRMRHQDYRLAVRSVHCAQQVHNLL